MNLENYKVSVDNLRKKCNIDNMKFNTTADIEVSSDIIGQKRAVEALEFGLEMDKKGYNVFVAGEIGTGRSTYTEAIVKERSKEVGPPFDWLYARNFKKPDEPMALYVKNGMGKMLKENVDKIVERLKKQIPEIFMSKEYENQRNILIEEYQNYTKDAIDKLNEIAKDYGFVFQKTERGLISMPVLNGKILNEMEYRSLSEEEIDYFRKNSAQLSIETIERFNELRMLEEEYRTKVKELDKKIGFHAVDYYIRKLKAEFSHNECIEEYLKELQEDIIENINHFKGDNMAPKQPLPFLSKNPTNFFERYEVNLLVDNSSLESAPIVVETNPSYYNLIGRVEYKNEMGLLKTDLMKIKPGAFHKANGGYLIIQAKDLLMNPFAFGALKRALKTNKVNIEGLDKQYGYIITSTLKPQPIELNVKVILIGDMYTYQLLYHYDEDFRKLFKVMADFDIEMKRNDRNIMKMVELVALHCKKEKLYPFTKEAVECLIEYSSRICENKEKLTAKFNKIVDIVYEADKICRKEDKKLVDKEHVQETIDRKISRNNKYEEKLLEMIESGDILIDIENKKIGQINGLAVIGNGEYSFGKPSKITVTTYKGKKGIINIEREVKKSGSIHDKGVMILNGYIGQRFAQKNPLSLNANIVFEQLYSGVDGDSASSTELYAILSSLAEVPIKQSIGVTGSVNQNGEIQPIGGVNEKIEGFYKVCKLKGLNKDQGVLIPHQNVKHLMLNDEVVEAVEKGDFHIYAIKTIEEGIEILTEVEAGHADDHGNYLENSIFYLVNKKLEEFVDKEDEEKKGD
ncbi:Lon protease family protein [Anaeromicrobium sediminis]|uniref:endopeptidase La n=1 Tax=Anaeromicrobium sediminis TaxID=1478221 RepID=A0A267MIL2_9FIRM|nr:ATP-binding protein [Anaeromicrobium sediminis]PAB58768.1 ATP-dependent protease [Anaeromicrobium sediminis]